MAAAELTRPAAAFRRRGTERRHRIVLRPRDDEDRAVLLAGQRIHEQLQADSQRERLVRALAAEGTRSASSSSPASTAPYVTLPIDTSVTTGLPSLDGIAIASGFVPVSFGPPSG